MGTESGMKLWVWGVFSSLLFFPFTLLKSALQKIWRPISVWDWWPVHSGHNYFYPLCSNQAIIFPICIIDSPAWKMDSTLLINLFPNSHHPSEDPPHPDTRKTKQSKNKEQANPQILAFWNESSIPLFLFKLHFQSLIKSVEEMDSPPLDGWEGGEMEEVNVCSLSVVLKEISVRVIAQQQEALCSSDADGSPDPLIKLGRHSRSVPKHWNYKFTLVLQQAVN